VPIPGAPPPQHPVCVTAASYCGRLLINLLFDELKLGTGQAGAIGKALVDRLREAAAGSLCSPAG
jgi:hypothetical protein